MAVTTTVSAAPEQTNGAPKKTTLPRTKSSYAGLSTAEVKTAYEVALDTRGSIITAMQMKLRGEGIEFWIGGPGEEIHGAATAMACHDAVLGEGQVGDLSYFCHYRSDALAAMTSHLRGHTTFVKDYFRQGLSRVTDPHSAGRQMMMHVCMPQLGLMPVQSPLGMQLGKAAGYARGLQLLEKRGIAVAIIGDGTMAESDLHETMHAASLWNLPLLIIVTDNDIAISVGPEDGRGIRDLSAYCRAFDIQFFSCDGHDFLDTYRVTTHAAQEVLSRGKTALLHARVPRLMGHSSSSGGQFDFEARDPLLEFGQWLVAEGILTEDEIFVRGEVDKRRNYFEIHQLGSIMAERLNTIRQTVAEVREEPTPSVTAGDVFRHTMPPFPDVRETTPLERPTRVQINEALNLALDRTLAGGRAMLWGQDVGHRGGIFQVTAGLRDKYPSQVRDAPINEPLIIGTATGAALHPDLVLLPEIQFGDYSLNCLHWFVHLGNLHWTSNGQVSPNVTVRFPVDPVMGGAPYHSMSCDGFYGNIPGLVITIPSTAYDAYGLLRTSADYQGPVVQMEPKRIYRMKLGNALPGEPGDAKALQAIRRAGTSLPIEDYRVPFGKLARRRAGADVTIVSWGWASWQSVAAADRVATAEGIEAEVLDLRTLVPFDIEGVIASAQRTGKVLIIQNDRTFAGFGRELQGQLIEHLPGISVRLVGQRNTPAVGQSRVLEDAITLQESDVEAAIVEMARSRPQAWLNNELHWLAHAPGRQQD